MIRKSSRDGFILPLTKGLLIQQMSRFLTTFFWHILYMYVQKNSEDLIR